MEENVNDEMKDCVWQLILKGPDETMKNDSEQLSKTDQCCLFAFKHQMRVGPCRRKGKSQRRTMWTMSQTMFQARTNRPEHDSPSEHHCVH